jgi:hypothetical protein
MNEPIGYYYAKACFDIRDCSEQMKHNGIPLYTHPVKTLTDGEIMQVWWDANDITDDDTVIDFARAILRKAQE